MAACLAADAPTPPLITQDDDDDDGHLPINKNRKKKNRKKNSFLKIDLLRLLIFPFLFFSFLFYFFLQTINNVQYDGHNFEFSFASFRFLKLSFYSQ